jgi:hypothetical protein
VLSPFSSLINHLANKQVFFTLVSVNPAPPAFFGDAITPTLPCDISFSDAVHARSMQFFCTLIMIQLFFLHA